MISVSRVSSCGHTPIRARICGPSVAGSSPGSAASRRSPATPPRPSASCSICRRRWVRGTRTPPRGARRRRSRAPPRSCRRTCSPRRGSWSQGRQRPRQRPYGPPTVASGYRSPSLSRAALGTRIGHQPGSIPAGDLRLVTNPQGPGRPARTRRAFDIRTGRPTSRVRLHLMDWSPTAGFEASDLRLVTKPRALRCARGTSACPEQVALRDVDRVLAGGPWATRWP